MVKSLLYSIILELCAVNTATIPAHRGDHTHALFLDLVRQVDAELSSRLHDEPEYRPFTVSVLHGARVSDGNAVTTGGTGLSLTPDIARWWWSLAVPECVFS